MLLSFTTASAQKATSITLGVSPLGYAQSRLYLDKEHDFQYNYKAILGANICFEKQFRGIASLTEISYAQADFDNYKFKGETMSLDVNKFEKLMDVALTQYWGGTLVGKNKRVQLPMYFGIGAEYVKGGALKNVCFDLAAKLRLKIYISGNIGIYVGGTARAGVGLKTDKSVDENVKDEHYAAINLLCTPDAGLVISF